MTPPDRIAVVGFGYVALPTVHAFAHRFSGTMGFEVSGAKFSPERIIPGDTRFKARRMVKVVAGEDEVTLERVTVVRSAIVDVGVRRAPSIRVAEAARAIANTEEPALDPAVLPIGLEYWSL